MTAALDSHVNITLDSLAAEINREHEAVKAAFQKGLEHAIKAGEHLIEAKKAVPHGKWGTWLSDHCSVSERMAQHYMKVASEFPKLEPANAKRVSDLSLRAALRASHSWRSAPFLCCFGPLANRKTRPF